MKSLIAGAAFLAASAWAVSSASGESEGNPGPGAQGDRSAVIFASFADLTSLVQEQC